MGNGSFCLNSKEPINDKINTLHFQNSLKETQKLFSKNVQNDYFNHTNPTINIIYPNYYTNNNNNSNVFTINSRKWYKASTNAKQDDSTIYLSNINNIMKDPI